MKCISTTYCIHFYIQHSKQNAVSNAYDWYKFSTKQYRALYMERSIIFTGFVYISTVYT